MGWFPNRFDVAFTMVGTSVILLAVATSSAIVTVSRRRPLCPMMMLVKRLVKRIFGRLSVNPRLVRRMVATG